MTDTPFHNIADTPFSNDASTPGDLQGVGSMVVEAEPDDTPSDMDDGICISFGYLDLLLQRAAGSTSVPHCQGCTCTKIV